MSDIPTACYLPTGERGTHGGEVFESTRLAAAEWYPDGQHGGVAAALLTRAVERRPSLTEMEVARVTCELFRVVPVTRLEVVSELVREGKRIQTTQVRLLDGDLEVARALVQRLRVAELDFPDSASEQIHPPSDPLTVPEEPFTSVMPFAAEGPVSFGRHAVRIRQAEGTFTEPGPATVWLAFDAELVAGEPMSPTQRAVIASDFSNGLSRMAEAWEVLFMNSDLSVHLARPPIGEWVALDGESIWNPDGRGVATSHLFDAHGPIGRATQTLFLGSPG
ncbi:MAG: thioesterase family protein [Acidimicrobiia bacterium]|nr:thioesterase family protein [Acidimicrobiia bacterium]